MALMNYREGNHVLWRGVRPAHDGTQVLESNFKVGVGTSVIYTVPVGKVFYLTYFSLSYSLSAAAQSYCDIEVQTAVPALWEYLLSLQTGSALQGTEAVSLYFPIEIPAAYPIWVRSAHANITTRAIIAGWYE